MRIINLLDWEPTAQSYKAFSIELPTDTQLVCISSNKREDEKYPYKEFIGYCDYKPGTQLKKTEYYHFTIIGQYIVFWFEGYEFEPIEVKEGKEIQFPYPVYINEYYEEDHYTTDNYYKIIGIGERDFNVVTLEHKVCMDEGDEPYNLHKITDFYMEFKYFDECAHKDCCMYQTKEDFDRAWKVFQSQFGQ